MSGTLGDIVVDDACQFAYASNTTQNRIEVLSLQTRTLLAPIQVGSKPAGFDITPDGTRMYVANSGGNNISVVDLTQRLELRKITVPATLYNGTPYSIAIANNGLALISLTGSGWAPMLQLNLTTEVATERRDVGYNGLMSDPTKLRASGDRSIIGIGSGGISSGPVYRYTAATDTFSGEKSLNVFLYNISVDRTGTKFLVTPGGFVIDAALSLSGTIALDYGRGETAIDPAGVIAYRPVASRVDVMNLSTFLKTTELTLPDTVDPFGTAGQIDISRDGTLLVVTTDRGIAVVPAAPSSITAISPPSAPQSTTLNVAVTGDATHFVQGQTTAGFGPGIVVHGVTVSDATHASVHITIPSGTPSGQRNVVITTGAEVKTALNAFTVTAGAAIRRMAPNRAQPGQQHLSIEISATEAHFTPNVTTVSFGSGITVTETRVLDANRLTATVAIAPDATLGQRNVLVTTGNELVTLANGFTVRRLPAPSAPRAYVVGRRVSSSGAQIVTVVDTSANVITATIPVGNGCPCVGPNSIALSPDGASIYVANEYSGTVSVIDAATNSLTGSIPAGLAGPTALTVSPDGTQLYVLLGSSPAWVKVIDTSSFAELSSITLGITQARGMAMTPDGRRLYVSSYGSNTVKVVDTETRAVVGTIPVGSQPVGVDVSPDGSVVYVTNSFGSSTTRIPGTVSVISTATNTVVGSIPVGYVPYMTKFSPDGRRAYVANAVSPEAWVIDTATRTAARTVAGSTITYALTFTPDGGRAYFSNDTSLLVADTATDTIVGSIPTPSVSHGLILSMAMSPGATRPMTLTGELDFGYVPVGGSATRMLTITNSGNAPLAVSSLTMPAGFRTAAAGVTVAAGASQQIAVIFAPTRTGAHSGTITVNGNQTSGRTTVAVSGYGTSDATRTGDFDRDSATDIAIYRPSSGSWFILRSSTAFGGGAVYSWGLESDVPMPGDYDGDGQTDVAVYRPSSGHWFILTSSSNYTASLTYQWGTTGDLPMAGDFDGDARSDLAIYRPSSGAWYVLLSSSGYSTGLGYTWGAAGDVPVPGDYDGDGRSDIAVFRPSTGHWFILKSSTGYTTSATYQWGTTGDIPVPGDYDGDNRRDLAIYRPSTGGWYILRSSSGFTAGAGYTWGAAGDVPVPGDYDGDGRTDIAVFRSSSGHWFILKSSSGYATSATYQWGTTGDVAAIRQK